MQHCFWSYPVLFYMYLFINDCSTILWSPYSKTPIPRLLWDHYMKFHSSARKLLLPIPLPMRPKFATTSVYSRECAKTSVRVGRQSKHRSWVEYTKFPRAGQSCSCHHYIRTCATCAIWIYLLLWFYCNLLCLCLFIWHILMSSNMFLYPKTSS